jgi:type IV secretion system protein VirB4
MLLKEFRSQAQGLPDLLPWAALIDNGVVLTKSGGLLAGFEFRGGVGSHQCSPGTR